MASRCRLKKLIELLELIEKHPAALASDFRKFYNISIFNYGVEYSYLETLYLIEVLKSNTESLFQSQMNGWKYPISMEYVMLTELYNLLKSVNWDKKKMGKFKPYPLPFDVKNKNSETQGKALDYNRAKEILQNAKNGTIKFKDNKQ